MTHLLIASNFLTSGAASWDLNVMLCRLFVVACLLSITYIFSHEFANPYATLTPKPAPRRAIRVHARWARIPVAAVRLRTLKQHCAVSTSHGCETQTSKTSQEKTRITAQATRSSSNRRRD